MKLTIRTAIKAPVSRVFDLARSMDLHTFSMRATGEEIVNGRSTGLIELNETVTFRGRHFGMIQTLKSKITDLDCPNSFTDELVQGGFRHLKHRHLFEAHHEGTVMTDHFDYQCPMSILGDIFDLIFLRRYMRRLLTQRAGAIKSAAESAAWRNYLKSES